MATISHSLFSSIVSLYILILIFFPHVFLKLLFSPLLISTLILLLTLLRLGASQQQQPSINPAKGANAPELILTQNDLEPGQEEVAIPQCNMAEAHSTMEPGSRPEPDTCDPGQSVEIDSFSNHDKEKESQPCQSWAGIQGLKWAELEPGCGPKLLLEWDVGAPLEVIYEASEGEEEGEEEQNDAFWKAGIIKRYPSLSRYYPESESDSYSDSSSSSISLDEEERGGLIEIALDNYGFNYGDKKIINMLMKPTKTGDQKAVDHYFDDEDNLIEIDISPTKIMSDFSW